MQIRNPAHNTQQPTGDKKNFRKSNKNPSAGPLTHNLSSDRSSESIDAAQRLCEWSDIVDYKLEFDNKKLLYLPIDNRCTTMSIDKFLVDRTSRKSLRFRPALSVKVHSCWLRGTLICPISKDQYRCPPSVIFFIYDIVQCTVWWAQKTLFACVCTITFKKLGIIVL
jgi:hypothetical protein